MGVVGFIAEYLFTLFSEDVCGDEYVEGVVDSAFNVVLIFVVVVVFFVFCWNFLDESICYFFILGDC